MAIIPKKEFFDLSTGHIKHSDDDLLRRCAKCDSSDTEAHALSIMVDAVDCGWIVTVMEDYQDYADSEMLREFGFSLAFIDLVRLASLRGVRGIWFDADAPRVRGLPYYSWTNLVNGEDELLPEEGE